MEPQIRLRLQVPSRRRHAVGDGPPAANPCLLAWGVWTIVTGGGKYEPDDMRFHNLWSPSGRLERPRREDTGDALRAHYDHQAGDPGGMRRRWEPMSPVPAGTRLTIVDRTDARCKPRVARVSAPVAAEPLRMGDVSWRTT